MFGNMMDFTKKYFARIVAVNALGLIGIVAGVLLGIFVGWKVGLAVGVVVLGVAFLMGLALMRRFFVEFMNLGGQVFKEVDTLFAQMNDETPADVARQVFPFGAKPPFQVPPVPPVPELHARYGVQHPTPREYFGKP
jgi:hypothetical protein